MSTTEPSPALFNLKAARINSGLPIAEIAERTGITESTYRRLEAGRQVSPQHAKKVADHFGVQVTDLPAYREIQAEAA
jgi:transcriptional regulator with XRE-family HTH domain